MIKLVRKDLKLFLGNKQDVLMGFALPIVFITLFASVFGNMQGSAEGNSSGLVHVVAGTSVMMVLLSVAGIGGGLLNEKEEGMLKKLLCSPLPAHHILWGKVVIAMMIAVAQLSVMCIYAMLVFGLDVISHLTSLLVLFLAIAFCCSSFGVFIASISKSRQQVQGLSTLIIFIMSGIGGSMIPVFVMPGWMQSMAVFSVNYWGVQGFYDIFLHSIPLGGIPFLSKVFVLTGIGLLLNVIAQLLFKRNILKIV